MITCWQLHVIICYLCCATTGTASSDLRCNVRVHLESGWVCGLIRQGDHSVKYASFRGIPYAQQPLGKLRFKELQPVRPWPHHLDATEEGPVCPQHDEIYGDLVKPTRGMSEACIYVNVHVPLEALSEVDKEYHEGCPKKKVKGFPIFVSIHGGGFQAGSGDADLHGPEYLVSKEIIVITFNYRINVFGFLSLNTPKIPGNAGLRDQVTLLRWVQRNARAFGGDPDDVTILGQSAGAYCAHLLALSNVTKGLFKRVIIMSGTALPVPYTALPVYAEIAATGYLSILGINSTDPDVIHDQLINTSLEDILNANTIFQYEFGFITFVPVIESKHPGIERIVDDNPRSLIERGRDKDYPMIIGFTNKECEFFRNRLTYLEIDRRIEQNPLLVLPADIPFSTPPDVAIKLAEKVIDRNFHGRINLDDFLNLCTDLLFHYPSFKVAQSRAEKKGAPVYMYQFSYEGDFNAVKIGLNLQYNGSAHVEDLTYIFRENAILQDSSFSLSYSDILMKKFMTQTVVNFIRCDKPLCGEGGWPPVCASILNYQDIHDPLVIANTPPTTYQQEMIEFYDKIDEIARKSSVDV